MRKVSDKPFNDWTAEDVEEAFGIKKLRSLPVLEHFATLRLATDHTLYALHLSVCD